MFSHLSWPSDFYIFKLCLLIKDVESNHVGQCCSYKLCDGAFFYKRMPSSFTMTTQELSVTSSVINVNMSFLAIYLVIALKPPLGKM